MNNDGRILIVEKAERLANRFNELCILTAAPEIIAHNSYWRRLQQEQDSIADIADCYFSLLSTEKELAQCFAEISGAMPEYKELLDSEISSLEQRAQKQYVELQKLLISFSHQSIDARVEISILGENSEYLTTLQNMYSAYAQIHGLKAKCIEQNSNKSAVLVIENLYQELQFESGIHKITNTNPRLSVSILVSVFKEEKLSPAEICEDDIRIDLFHSGGAGGQNVNKVESAIRATHIPTGIAVVCQDERSQLHNKERALRNLKLKVEDFIGKKQETELAIERKKVLSLARATQVRTYDIPSGKAVDQMTNIEIGLDKIFSGDLNEILSLRRISIT